MGRNLVYWDPTQGLTRYGRIKHIVAGGLWEERRENPSLCGKPLPRRVNSWEALNEWRTCQACEAVRDQK
ncbi:hypothetical protein OG352_06300 [Streptomyces sp. NBC_01485]|uniref:hypothetical protein n=1 Tax=Streptomyces sp. NBC_01485 TaxID=2903884 RepID=UPI002E315A1D|nr:hypothetical protein [Streptomyces sp. NBC_01485]